jgi:hypothetical protein
MIAENELRIGNWVTDRGNKRLSIDRIVGDRIECDVKGVPYESDTGIPMYYHPDTEYFEYLQPIPLTEEWLVKFGFTNEVVNVLENDNFKMSISYYDGWHLSYKEKQCFGSSEVYLYPANIGSVHALQNLYFSLTGQELTLK